VIKRHTYGYIIIYIYTNCHYWGKRIHMGHIGTIIKKTRQDMGISRKKFSENICSEKYIYYIEKGERSPSANMLKQLSERLGVNLFKYYKYIDCQEPFAVKEKMEQLNISRINLDFESLKELLTEAENMTDFKNKPWIYEIYFNRLYCRVYGEKKFKESLPVLETVLKEAKNDKADELFIANVYAILFSCYIVAGDRQKAKHSALTAYNILRKKNKGEIYNRIIVNVMAAYYVDEEYDNVIELGNNVLEIKKDKHSYARINYIYLFMCLSYYREKRIEEAYNLLEKTIFFLMIDYRPTDVEYMVMVPGFTKMLKDFGDSDIVRRFMEKYKI